MGEMLYVVIITRGSLTYAPGIVS